MYVPDPISMVVYDYIMGQIDKQKHLIACKIIPGPLLKTEDLGTMVSYFKRGYSGQ